MAVSTTTKIAPGEDTFVMPTRTPVERVIRNNTGRMLTDFEVDAINNPGPINQVDLGGNVNFKLSPDRKQEPVKEPEKEPEKKPVELTTGSTTAWTLEGDPTYQAAMAAGQAKFNYARNAAMADKNAAELAAKGERQQLDVNATEGRRRLAGNYAARGMAGGAAGALTLAEAQANARQVAAQTSIADKISAMNQQYLENFGATGTDWTGTLVGQQYKTDAAQAAITAQLARLGAA
jgi:hypothetical protein